VTWCIIHSSNSKTESFVMMGDMLTSDEQTRELALLESLEHNPEVRQADIAANLGVAVGTANWLIKRLVSKGYLKVKRIGRWQWRYLLTPSGFARKAKLTQRYLQLSMDLYRSTRADVKSLLQEVRRAGYTRVRIDGKQESDLLDICRLTCLEQGVSIAHAEEEGLGVPVMRVEGRRVTVAWPSAAGENQV